jgi:hypothetical protein
MVAGVPPQAKLPVTFPNIENEEGNRKKTWLRPHCDGTAARPSHICTGTGTGAHPSHICTGTGLAPAALDCAQP